MTPAPLHFGTERLMLDPDGLLSWPAQKLLAVADLHLEKGSSLAAAGRMVPPYDTRETLTKLMHGLRRWRPARLVLLGDSFHDGEGPNRLTRNDRVMLARITEGIELVWVLGNHDPLPPPGLPGEAAEEWKLGKLVFRHQSQPGKGEGLEVSGHFHPKASMPTRAGPITRPCFIADAKRVILPAFGAYTGGLAVTDPAIASLFPRGARAFLLGQDRLFSLPLAPGAARQVSSAAG